MLDEHTPQAFELMSEMLLGPTYPEVDSEREVVLEEIAMYEDEPQDRVHDVLSEAVFGDHPLGKRVIGRADVIASIPIPEISAYHGGRYTGPNIVVAAAGHLDHAGMVELAERHMGDLAGDVANGTTPPQPGSPRASFYEKETEQYHICLGAPGIARADERRFALGVLDAVFGGSTSSRLFREVREKRGLAYAVGSFSEQYTDAGTVACYVGTREDNVAEALEVIGGELRRLHADGVSEEEIERAKEHVKGRTVLGLESSAARMGRCARAILFGLPLLSLDEMLERIDAVSLDDVAELAADMFDPERFSAACVGPDEGRFRSALEPVSGTLAGATAA
jgi:predicted Zn-dependent peptidase